MPLPNVSVTIPQSEPYYAGKLVDFRCSISIDNAIDTPVGVAVTWLKDGTELSGTARARVFPARAIGVSHYEASLQFSTLSTSTDSGNYICRSTIYLTQNGNYVRNVTQTAAYSLRVTGKYKFWC